MYFKLILSFMALLGSICSFAQTSIHVDSARDVIDKRTINVYNDKIMIKRRMPF